MPEFSSICLSASRQQYSKAYPIYDKLDQIKLGTEQLSYTYTTVTIKCRMSAFSATRSWVQWKHTDHLYWLCSNKEWQNGKAKPVLFNVNKATVGVRKERCPAELPQRRSRFLWPFKVSKGAFRAHILRLFETMAPSVKRSINPPARMNAAEVSEVGPLHTGFYQQGRATVRPRTMNGFQIRTYDW